VAGMNAKQVAGLLPQTEPTPSAGMLDADGIGLTEAPPPRPVGLTVERKGQRPRRVTLEPSPDRPEGVHGVVRRDDNRWDFLADRAGKIAHVRVGPLGRGTARELADVLERLEQDEVRGLVLDLRWCPGGYLDEAVAVAGLFLDDGVLATVRGRADADKENKYHNTQPKRYTKWPLAVLVNGHTSGGAELIAAALQDLRRVPVAGQRTFGKASVQTTVYLNVPGANLKLTTGEFVRPSGKNLGRQRDSRPRDDWGVRPDTALELRLSPERDRELRDWWEQQTLRPGSDRHILPLDDPANDPQRQLAVRAVLEQLRR
jgi:carboxyl-terminal processing protease